MGEIILSICIGGSLALSGLLMNLALSREEKTLELPDQPE